jgi:menaquinone-dependent protoporphyrinogen oxidase
METVLIAYATREGHTREIASRAALAVRAGGLAAEIFDVSRLPEPFTLARFSAAILAASIHQGAHEPSMVAFVKRHRAGLVHLPSVFLSVSLSQATAQIEALSAEKRAQAVEAVEAGIARFVRETGWLPDHVHPVAGALPYTRYSTLLRWVMKRIARGAGGPTDTSRDYVFTDWAALDRTVGELVRAIPRHRQPASA